MRTHDTAAALAVILMFLPAGALAQTQTPPSPPQDPPTFQDTVQVTATRFGEPVAEVPNADRVTGAHFGSYQSGGVGGAAVLSAGRVRQSVSAELTQDNFSGERADFRRAQGIWRLATELGGGKFRADVDLLALRQRPNSPAPIDETTGAFSTLLPLDYNQNPRASTSKARCVPRRA
jgi:hypothetical protein